MCHGCPWAAQCNDSKLRGCDVVVLGSRTSHRAGVRSIAVQCGRRRPVGPSGMN
jgi:hypothetical protein